MSQFRIDFFQQRRSLSQLDDNNNGSKYKEMNQVGSSPTVIVVAANPRKTHSSQITVIHKSADSSTTPKLTKLKEFCLYFLQHK